MKVQMRSLAIFYLICCVTDWAVLFGGIMAVESNDLICYEHGTLFVNSNLGGFYMLFFSLQTYFYAIYMWYTFYQVPKKHGQINQRRVDDLEMLGDQSTILMGEENLKTVVREFEHDRRFTKRQQTIQSKGTDNDRSTNLTNYNSRLVNDSEASDVGVDGLSEIYRSQIGQNSPKKNGEGADMQNVGDFDPASVDVNSEPNSSR